MDPREESKVRETSETGDGVRPEKVSNIVSNVGATEKVSNCVGMPEVSIVGEREKLSNVPVTDEAVIEESTAELSNVAATEESAVAVTE